RLASVSDADDRPAAGLGSRNRGDVETAKAAVLAATARARALGLHRVILDPGLVPRSGSAGPTDLADPDVGWTRDRAAAEAARREVGLEAALDQVCRALHAIC